MYLQLEIIKNLGVNVSILSSNYPSYWFIFHIVVDSRHGSWSRIAGLSARNRWSSARAGAAERGDLAENAASLKTGHGMAIRLPRQ